MLVHKKVLCLLWPLLLCSTTVVNADVVFSIDAIPGGSLDSSRTVAVGEIFSVDIIASIDSSNAPNTSLSSYGISIQYDTAPIDLTPGDTTSATELLPAGFTFNLDAGVSSVEEVLVGDTSKGQVSTFEAAGFGAGPTAGSSFVIGQIDFVGSNRGASLITPGLFSVLDGAFNNDSNPIPIIARSAQITVVPEPSSALMLLVPVMASVLSRRRKFF